MIIGKIIKLVRSHHFYGCGEHIEIAKGKNQLVTDFSGLKRKANRLWQQKKKLK